MIYMITALTILAILILIYILFLWFTSNKGDKKKYPNADKKKDAYIEPVNKSMYTTESKNSKKLWDKFRYNRYKKGNRWNIIGVSPKYYGEKLLMQRNYSHKQTNK